MLELKRRLLPRVMCSSRNTSTTEIAARYWAANRHPWIPNLRHRARVYAEIDARWLM